MDRPLKDAAFLADVAFAIASNAKENDETCIKNLVSSFALILDAIAAVEIPKFKHHYPVYLRKSTRKFSALVIQKRSGLYFKRYSEN